MKKKVTVTAKAIVNDGEGVISIIVKDNLPKSAISIIEKYATVKYNEDTKLYHGSLVNSRFSDKLQYLYLTIDKLVEKLIHSLDRIGFKDCIIHEESITKTHYAPVEKITVGVDTRGGYGHMYVHVYLPYHKEYFELGIYDRILPGLDETKWHFISDETLKLSKKLSEDEYNIVEEKLLRVLDNLPKANKSFVKTIKC